MNPTEEITDEGLAAAGRIADARAKRDAESLQVSANNLVNPPKAQELTPPAIATQPRTGTVDAVSRNLEGLITAQTQEASDLRTKRQELADIGSLGTLGEFRESQLSEFGVPENFQRLQDIQLQLADVDEASALQKVEIASGGQGAVQGQRSLTQEDRENAVRRSGLAAQASVIQGNIDTATSLVNDAVATTFQDRQLQNQNVIAQINDLSGTVDDQTQQLLDQEKVAREADEARIQEVKDAVSGAMNSGAATPQEVAQLTDINASDEDRLALAQGITARGATEERDLGLRIDRATARSAEASAALSEQELASITNAGNDPDDITNTLANFEFLNNAAQNVIDLSGGASPNPTAEFIRKNIGSSSTESTQLEGFVDTLKANMLTLATDPSIKQFFGPQMSDADVRLMTAAGSNLRPDEQTPEQLKTEAERIQDWINRAATAVREGSQGNNFSATTITAPDGTLIEIIE